MNNEYDELIQEENEYDSLIKEEDAARSVAARVSLKASDGRTPDQQADINDLAQRAKLPTDVVARNTDQVRAQVEANEYDQIIKDSPELSGWMSNPDNAAISRDDVGSLARINNALKRQSNNASGLEESLHPEQGERASEYRSYEPTLWDRFQEMIAPNKEAAAVEYTARRIAREQGISVDDVYEQAGGRRSIFNPEGRAPIRAAVEAGKVVGEQLPNIPQAAANTVLRVIRGGNIDADPGLIDRWIAGTDVPAPEDSDPNYESFQGIGQSLGYSLTTLAAGAVSAAGGALIGNAPGAVAGGMAGSGAVAYRASKDDFLSRVKAGLDARSQSLYDRPLSVQEWEIAKQDFESAATKYGAWEAIPEAVSNLVFMKALSAPLKKASSSFLRRTMERAQHAIMEGLPSENITETMTSVGQSQAEQEAGLRDKSLTVGEAFRQQVIPTTLITLGMGGAGATAKGAYDFGIKHLDKLQAQQKIRKAEAGQQVINEVATAAQESKLLDRSPEKFKEAVRDLGQKSGQEAVYIPVEELTAYYQSKGIDPGAEVAKLTGDTQAYQQALETGADIKIPIESFAADIAPTHYEGLKDHIRTEPDAMTPAEAAEFDKRKDEIAAGFVDTQEGTDTSPQVYDAVLSELIDAGIETKAAEKQAKLYSSVFRSLGQRTGLDPVTLYNRYGLSVSRADMPTVERRNVDLRADFEKLPKEEQFRIAYSDPLSGLLNKRAFEKLPPKRFRVAYDLDSLGYINDNASHSAGDTAIKETAKALIAQHGNQDAFRTGGDEFWGQADTLEEAQAMAKAAQEALKNVTIWVTNPGEKPFLIKGLGLSFGIGEATSENTADEIADQQLLKDKRRREESGERAKKGTRPRGFADAGAGDRAGLNQEGRDVRSRESLSQDGDTTLNQAPADAEVSVSGQSLNQPPPPLDGPQRGMITFNDQRTRFSILLFKNADMSTLLHESGHFYFEVLGDLVRRGEASQQIQDDYKAILNWVGNTDGKISQNQHEQFARGFEAYLMEGKAPSTELAGVFARFRAWLTQIYRTVKNLDVELSDEIRAVFDRLVASEDEIAAAEREQDYRVVFGDNPVLNKIAAEAREAAETRLANQAMKEIARQEKATWKENRKTVMGEVAAQVNSRPVYQVLAYLGKGTLPDGSPLPAGMEPVKLSKKALLTRYDQNWITRNLFKKKVYTNDGGVDPELLAPAYGFESGDAMVRSIAAAEPLEDVIARETDAEMKRRYGDMMTDGTMRQKAMDAVHNSKREELLLAELKAIRKKTREAAPFVRQAQQDAKQARQEAESILPSQKELRFIKASAENLIAQKKVREINPNLYRVAEAKAGRIAFEAAAKGDYEKAYASKLQQIRNHALYRAATKAKADSEKVLRFLKRFQKKGLRTKLGKVKRLEQVDMLLDRYDLRKRSNKAIDIGKAKLELLTQIQSGLMTAPKTFTDSLRGNDKVNFRDETIEALRGLRDVLTQIRTEALGEFEAMVNGEKIRLDEAADQMANTVSTNGKSVIPTYGELSAEERMQEFGKSMINAWLRTPTLARLLDNDQRGAWTRYVIEPVRKAVAEKLEPLKDKAKKDLAKLYSDHYSVNEMVKNNERSVVPGINLSLSRWDLISLALNWGNTENRKAVIDSTVAERQPFTEQGVMRAFQMLDKRDTDFVQAVWNYVDTYWPEIKESQRRRRGITPPKVEADPFTITIKDGQIITLPGGYFPLKYNPRLDAKSRQNEIDDAFEKMRVGTMSSTQTKYGHTQERVGSGGQPVMLSMGVLHNHINNVIMDIALGDAVIYVDKVLARPQVRQSLIDTGNLDALESFKLWLKDVATGELSPRSGGEQAAKFIRLGFAKSKIGFNLVTTALQVAGLPQTMVVTGKQNFAKGAMEYAKNPRAAIRQVMSQSKLMYNRYELNSYNKEIQGVYEALGNKGAPANNSSSWFARNFIALFKAVQIPPWLLHAAFLGMKYSQLQVDTITWLAGYEQAKARDLPHAEAVTFADGVVENAQTSGMWNDRAPIERGTLSANTRQNEYVKLLTTLGSYMIAKGNIAVEKYQATDFKNAGQALGFAGDMMFLFSVEAILGAAIRGQMPDDDEDWWWWAIKQSMNSAISTIPILREFPGAMQGFATGGPLGSFISDLGKATTQSLQGEIDLPLIKAYSNVIGTLTGYPSAQFNRMVSAYWRESEGEDVPAYEYATGPRN